MNTASIRRRPCARTARHSPAGLRARLAAPLSAVCLALAGLGLVPAAASAQGLEAERLQVTDPYIELHTGPGRGYPVFHVALREEWIQVELRRTDWFKVRTADGRVGWVPRAQLDRTLTEAGSVKTFRDVMLDDYLRRRVEFGGAWGRFKSEPMLKLWAGWRVSDSLALEATAGQVQGTFSGSDFWHVAVTAEPWSERRLSPFFGIGVGRFRNIPNASLVDARSTDANLAHAVLGLRWHLSERFVLRADYTRYTAFIADERSVEYGAASVGLSFFF